MNRQARIERRTAETAVTVALTVDGRGRGSIGTGIPFFDHMLDLFARHGLFDLEITAQGDLAVDLHHTVEDVGLALGQAFAQALGDKAGIRRYGAAYVPMDDALARAVIDLSGRPYLAYQPAVAPGPIGDFSFQLVEEFLRAFSVRAACNLHVEVLAGRDAHHVAEAIFKALAKALDAACQIDPRVEGVPSTKGVL